MNYENVKLWFAKSECEDIVTISDVNNENKNNTYLCPVCGSDLKPKAIESKRISPHFAHVDSSKCNSETMIHWWFKHKFLEKGDDFIVVSDKERLYVCKDILVEKSYGVDEETYRPDVTVLTECGETIFFEMVFSNKKKVKDYIDIWLELKNIVVEVDIKHLMDKDSLPSFKALFYDGKCFNTKKNDAYYNTIGKYKEEKLQKKSDEKLKERIRKLDWLWDDILRYKIGEIDDENLVGTIMLIDVQDIEFVINVLKNQKCIGIHELIIRRRLEIIYGEIEQLFKMREVSHQIYKEEIIKYKKLQTIIIKVYGWKFGYLENLDVLKYSVEDIVRKLNFKINYNIIGAFCDEKYEYFNSDQYALSYTYDHKDKIKFEIKSDSYKNHELELRIPKEILNSKDTNYIKNFVDREFSNLTIGMVTPINGKILHNYLNKFSVICGNYIIKKESITKNYDITYRLSFDYLPKDNGIIINTRVFGMKDSSYSYCINFNKIYKENSIEINTENLYEVIINSLVSLIENYFTSYNCNHCHDSINLRRGEIKFYLEKGFELPKRCKSCRNKRRIKK